MLHFLVQLARNFHRPFHSQNLALARNSIDPVLLCTDMPVEKSPLVIATIFACLFHLMLFLVVDLPARQARFEPTKQVIMLARLIEPQAGALRADSWNAAKSLKAALKSALALVPIPDPTPVDPEPIRRTEVNVVTPIVPLMGEDLSIGEIGPPSDRTGGNGDQPKGEAGNGSGNQPGGDAYNYPPGEVSLPALITHHLPQYTDEAIKARVEGVVYLQVVIRKNGKADSFQVVKGLGYGLEQKAIEEIARSWIFRPATSAGVAVDFPTLIEVTFSLR